MKYKQALINNQELFIQRLIELLKINSIYDDSTKSPEMPFGAGIEKALTHFLNMAQADGFQTLKDGGYAGHIEYGGTSEDAKLIGILCHLDVVPVGDDWSADPFDPQIIDGRIIARGAMDDKGPTMAAYSALKIIKDLQIPLKNKIRIILGTDEETGWRGIEHYFQNYEMPEIGFAPDADFPLIYGEKGMIHGYLQGNGFTEEEDLISIKGGSRFNIVIDKAEAQSKQDHSFAFYQYLQANNLLGSFQIKDGKYYYEIIGTAAHAMEPFKGVNAGTHLCNFFKAYTSNPLVHFVSDNLHEDFSLKKLGLEYISDEMGSLTCNVGIIDLTKSGRVALDLRYPIGFEYDNFINVMQKNLGSTISLADFTNKVPHYVDPHDSLVEGLYQIYVKHTNDFENKPLTIGGGTYARALKKAVAFGMEMPGDPTVAHQKDESIKISAYLQAILIYVDAILFLGVIDA